MDSLHKFSVSCEQSREEFLQSLNRAAVLDDVKALRNSLFIEAMKKSLVDSGDLLVMRRKVAGGKSKS